MFFRQIFDPGLAQYAYLIGCQRTGEALIIDPGCTTPFGAPFIFSQAYDMFF